MRVYDGESLKDTDPKSEIPIRIIATMPGWMKGMNRALHPFRL